MRHFNFAIQVFTLSAYLIQGNIKSQHITYILVLIVAVSIPAILGAKLFYKISEIQFKKIVLSLLFASGVFMSLNSFI